MSQGEAPVLQQPGEGGLHGPALRAQAGAVRLSPLGDARLDAEASAQDAAAFGVIAAIGIGGPDPGHDGKGVQEQPLEQQRVGDVGARCDTGERRAVTADRDMVFRAHLGAVGGVGAD